VPTTMGTEVTIRVPQHRDGVQEVVEAFLSAT
jgi:hypothetical protein